MIKQWLTKLTGTIWSGSGELWLDPEGNNAAQYDCQLNVEADAIYYSWSYENEIKKGSFTFNEEGAIWIDSWHQPKSVQCLNILEAWSIFSVSHTYDVPSSPSWGWQSKLSERPDGALVLQMTNITPWGEDGRAVKMVFIREKA
jgi:hypothetical protein